MKTPMVLLVFAVVLLVRPAVAGTSDQKLDSLKSIIDNIVKVNKSMSEGLFVEEVKHLADGCENKVFFCKVHDVLIKHNFTSLGHEEKMVVRNLKQLNLRQTANCTVLLKGVNSTGIEIQMPEFMKELEDRCKMTILNMGKKCKA